MWQNLKNIYHYFQALFASLYFHFPSRKIVVIGVTGTDGKTTTVNMLQHILAKAGKRVSSISTVDAQVNGKLFETGFHVTTPSPWQVQKYINKAASGGSEFFVLEATSHGLDQNRLAFVKFEIAIITNISHEHLDYHGNKKRYLESKAKLFKNVKYSILNADDQSYSYLKSRADGQIISYSRQKNVNFNLKKYPIKLNIIGTYNLENALAAISSAVQLGINKNEALKALVSFEGVKGRMQKVDTGLSFCIYIDFAHTPKALENALKTLRENTTGRLIAVFGSAGERDKAKRSLMGQVAAKIADISILTAEDPRTEDANKICNQIAQGFLSKNKKENKDYFIMLDREKAIKFAISISKKNDTIGIFGKGHEKSMNIKGQEIPWNEAKIVNAILKEKKT